jgi:hypothetical protein
MAAIEEMRSNQYRCAANPRQRLTASLSRYIQEVGVRKEIALAIAAKASLAAADIACS